MAKLQIIHDSNPTVYVAPAEVPWLEYVEVPDGVWEQYVRARDALDAAETELLAYDIPANRVNPADDYEGN